MPNPCSGGTWQRLTAPYRTAWANAGVPCAICREPIDYTLRSPNRMALTVDHRIARWAGGPPLDPGNWQPAHQSCNSRRGARETNPLRGQQRPNFPVSRAW